MTSLPILPIESMFKIFMLEKEGILKIIQVY